MDYRVTRDVPERGWKKDQVIPVPNQAAEQHMIDDGTIVLVPGQTPPAGPAPTSGFDHLGNPVPPKTLR